MATEFTWSTVSSTLTDKLNHPVKDFLIECGIDVSEFPRLRLLVEVHESIHRNTQVYIPLRVPGRPGVIFETYCRVIRHTEVPKFHESGHRRFVELEWLIEEDPVLEAEHHAVFSFLSGEVECPSCRQMFNPEPSILDDKSVKVTCDNCLHYWTIKVDSPLLNAPRLKLITDVFYKDPAKIQKSLADWDRSRETNHEEYYRQFFPVDMDSFEVEGPIEFLFGNRTSFRIKGGLVDQDFEVLSKTLINFLTFNYFRQPGESRYSSQLDKTDICRKSEIAFKEEQQKNFQSEFFPTREFETIKSKPSSATPFQSLHFGDTVVKEMKWDIPKEVKTQSRSYLSLFVSVFASLILISGLGFYFWMNRSPEQTITAIESVKETPAPVVEKIVENKLEAPTATEMETSIPKNDIPVPVEVKKEEVAAKKIEDKPIEKKVEPVIQKQALKKEAEKIQVRPDEPIEGRQLARVALIDAGYRQGMLHLKLQQAKEAAQEFERVIEMDPKHVESYRNLGLAYVYERRFEEAISVFEKYLNLAGNSPDRNSVEELLVTLKDRVSISEVR